MAASLQELLGSTSRAEAAPLCVGIEQEFEVWRGEERLDFRDIIHTLDVPGIRLDPGDVNAYRLQSGLALTCDEAEAELASPPIPIAPGFAGVVTGHTALMRRTLEELLPEGVSIRGYSTHLSVSVPGPPDIELAERWARTFGPLFGAIADRAESQGIYVRPRPGRLELCSDFIEGRRLEAAAAFAAGSVFAARESLWPEAIKLDLFPCNERFGFRVHRRSPGFDLYTAGRGGVLGLAEGGEHPLGALFERAARLATAAVEPNSCRADLDELRAIASGTRPFGIEAADEPEAALGETPNLGYGLAGRCWQTGSAAVMPWRATWDYAMFEVSAAGEPRRYVSVPSVALPRLAMLVGRDVDGFARAVLAQPAAELTRHEQTGAPAVFAAAPNDPEVLLPGEVPVSGSGATKAARARPKSARIGKVVAIPPILLRPAEPVAPIPLAPFPPPAPRPSAPVTPVAGPGAPTPLPVSPPASGPPWPLIGILGAAVLGAIAVVGVIVAGGGESHDEPATPVMSHAVIPSVTLTPPKPTEAPAMVKPSETAVPSAAATPTALPGAATVAATPTAAIETPGPTSTATSQPQPSETPGAALTQTPTPTLRPTETPRPTATPPPTATNTPLIVPPGDTPAPRPIDTPPPTSVPTATPCQGAACI